MSISHGFIQWILAYLTNRTPFVCFDINCCSDVIITNTAAPQGTVLVPFIFTLHTADCRAQDVDNTLIKHADYTAMIGLIRINDDTKYQLHLKSLVDYCNTNNLPLNISKTKELFKDFCRTASPPPAVLSNRVEVGMASSYKYLGVHLNDCLSWSDQVDVMIKKLNNMLCCMRTLAKFNVITEIINIINNSTIGEVLRYCLVAWCDSATKADIERIDRIIRNASKVIRIPQTNIDSICTGLRSIKLNMVWTDTKHSLYLHNNTISGSIGSMLQTPLKTNQHWN